MFLAVQVIVLKQFYAYQWRYDKGWVIYRKTFIESRYIGTIQVIDKIIDTKSRIVKLLKNYWYQEMCQIITDKYIWKTKLISVLFYMKMGGNTIPPVMWNSTVHSKVMVGIIVSRIVVSIILYQRIYIQMWKYDALQPFIITVVLHLWNVE